MFIPNPQQRKAIEHPPSPLILIAGAGTGKTSTLILRIKHFIENRIAEPENVVVLTFTEKATAEIHQRIRMEVGKNSDSVFISTFHAFCNNLVREYSSSEDVEKVLWLDPDITSLFIRRFDDLDFLTSYSFKSDPVQAITQGFINFFNRIRDELLSPPEVQTKFKSIDLREENIPNIFPVVAEKIEADEITRQLTDLVKVYEWYQKQKKKLNVVDYGDMILDCWKMLSLDARILGKVRNRFRHIIIDEYQDNNYALNRIVNLIAAENPSITVVGDEDQCIYSFRGANYYNIHDFEERYSNHPDYALVTLEENHRSTQEILDIANVSIAHNTIRKAKTLHTPKVNPKRGPLPIWYISERVQALSGIPAQISKLVNSGEYQYGDMAVICRSWTNVKAVAEVLQHHSIPVDVHVEKFFSVPLVKEVLAWGHLIQDDYRRETALFRILQQHLGEEWTEEFFRQNRKATATERLNLLEKLKNDPSLPKEQLELLKWILAARTKLEKAHGQHRKADEMVWTILEVVKDTEPLRNSRHNYRYRERLNLANLGELMSIAEIFATREDDPSLEAWLNYMDVLQLDLNMPATQPETYDTDIAVQVLTVHSSKGLQFPVVMIPFLRAGTFPASLRPPHIVNHLPEPWREWSRPEGMTVHDEHLEEERRMFYVAVTRTKDLLYLFGPEKAQSRFTKELQESDNEIMEINVMTDTHSGNKSGTNSELKQKLLVELNREIAAHQHENVMQIAAGLKSLDEEGSLPADHPYHHLIEKPTEIVSPVSPDRLLTLSATSISEYNSCPLKYRLAKIDKVPERKSKAAMVFGKIIHDVLEEYHNDDDMSLKQLLTLLKKHWKEDAFEYLLRAQEFKRQGEEILSNYFEYVQANPPEVVGRECYFEFAINKIKVKITGKIDRIDQEGNTLALVDYKTSKNKESAKGSLQLALYTEAVLRDAVDKISGEPGSAALHFLRHADDPLSSHQFTEADLTKHLSKVEKAADGIRKGAFDPKPSDFTCRHCDFREFLCPAWEYR